jgi:hypothetical protein
MDIPFFLIAVLGVLAFIIYKWYNSEKVVIKRKFKKTQHKKIAEFSDGDVAKFTGIIESIDEPLISPLSHRKCTYYSVHIEQKVSSGKSSHWKTLIIKSSSTKFIIRGENACAYINGGRQKKHIVMDRKFSSGFMDDPELHLADYLKAHGHSSENFMGMNKTIRYKEGVLELGEKIAVLGKGEWKTPEELDLPSTLGKVLSISDYENEFVYFTDEEETTLLAEQKIEPKRVKEKSQASHEEEYERRNEEMRSSTRESNRRNKEPKRKGRYLK